MEEAVEGEEHCCGSEDRKRRTGGAGGVEEGRLEEKSRKVSINDRNTSPFPVFFFLNDSKFSYKSKSASKTTNCV